MKVAKKTVWLVIALMPFLSVLTYMAGNIGKTAGADVIPLGDVTINETAEGARIVSVTPDSWGDYILTPLYGENAVAGFYGAVAGLASYISVNAGVPLSVPLLASVFLLCYLAIIELLSMVVDFLLFVPRKCMTLFE